MSAGNSRESLRSILISYEEYQRLKTIESRFEQIQKENHNKKLPQEQQSKKFLNYCFYELFIFGV